MSKKKWDYGIFKGPGAREAVLPISSGLLQHGPTGPRVSLTLGVLTNANRSFRPHSKTETDQDKSYGPGDVFL